jgi:hypothetical protein
MRVSQDHVADVDDLAVFGRITLGKDDDLLLVAFLLLLRQLLEQAVLFPRLHRVGHRFFKLRSASGVDSASRNSWKCCSCSVGSRAALSGVGGEKLLPHPGSSNSASDCTFRIRRHLIHQAARS